MGFYSRHGGVWKDGVPYARHGGVWKPAQHLYARHDGVWKGAFATAAFPTVVGTTSNATSGDTHQPFTISVPSGVVAGALLIAFITHNSASDSMHTPSGWTRLNFTSQGSANSGAGGYTFYREATGIETSVVFGNDFNRRWAGIAYLIEAWSGTPAIATATGSSSSPNPPSLSPSGGADNCLWLAVAQVSPQEQGISFTGFPSGFADSVTAVSSGSTNSSLQSATASVQREENAASLNPSAFGISTSSAWVAATVAISPG